MRRVALLQRAPVPGVGAWFLSCRAVQSWMPQRRGRGGSEIRDLGQRHQTDPGVGRFWGKMRQALS